MKKLSLALMLLPTAFASAAESDKKLNVKLSGYVDSQYGHRQQKDFFSKTYSNGTIGTDRVANSALVNKTRLVISADHKLNSDVKYGAYIRVYADTNSSSAKIGDKVFMYMDSIKHGRLEVGGGSSATSMMGLNAGNIARAAGGINGDAKKWIAGYADFPGATNGNDTVSKHFLNEPSLPVDAEYLPSLSKITYISPRFYGFQAGISYIFDTALYGTVAKTHSYTSDGDRDYKKMYTPAINYEYTYGDIKYKAALTMQHGVTKTTPTSYLEHDMKAYEFGYGVDYKNLSLVASFGDWTKTAAEKPKRADRKYGTSYQTLGAAYTHGNLSTSVTMFRSRRANTYAGEMASNLQDVGFNKFKATSIGVDYKLAPGLKPYAEVTYFDVNQFGDVRKNNARVILAGIKLSF